MGRTPSCGKLGLKRGPWTPEEDLCLTNYVKDHGEGRWGSLSKKAGLLRSGKSCRMRWLNYLQPDVKRGRILPDEEDLILRLHRLLGNRWSLIAGRLPGRTDNDVKNHWNIRLSKKLISQGIDPRTHKPLSESEDIWWNPEESNMEQNFLQTSATLESCNQEIHEKHSDFIIADHKEDSSAATAAISGFPSGPTVFSSTSEIVGYGEVSNYNCCEMPKQETYSSRFPFSLPATPTAFINEDFDQLAEDNSASNPKYELWSRLLSPSMHHHPFR